jgi:hypothetical protein
MTSLRAPTTVSSLLSSYSVVAWSVALSRLAIGGAAVLLGRDLAQSVNGSLGFYVDPDLRSYTPVSATTQTVFVGVVVLLAWFALLIPAVSHPDRPRRSEHGWAQAPGARFRAPFTGLSLGFVATFSTFMFFGDRPSVLPGRPMHFEIATFVLLLLYVWVTARRYDSSAVILLSVGSGLAAALAAITLSKWQDTVFTLVAWPLTMTIAGSLATFSRSNRARGLNRGRQAGPTDPRRLGWPRER